MFRRPKGLARRDVNNLQVGKKHTKIFGTLFHAGLLRHFVAEYDHRLMTALRAGIAHVLDRLPFSGFTDDQDLNLVTAEGENLFL